MSLRTACRLGALVLIASSMFKDTIPPPIGIPLGLVGAAFAMGDVAFYIHDRNQSGTDTSSLNLHK